MTDVIEVWLIISGCISVSAAVFGLIGLFITSGYRRSRSEARVTLGAFITTFLSPLWPLGIVLGITVGLPRAVRGLWSDADLPTPAERRRARRQEAAAAADARVMKQQRYIERLEREAGIR